MSAGVETVLGKPVIAVKRTAGNHSVTVADGWQLDASTKTYEGFERVIFGCDATHALAALAKGAEASPADARSVVSWLERLLLGSVEYLLQTVYVSSKSSNVPLILALFVVRTRYVETHDRTFTTGLVHADTRSLPEEYREEIREYANCDTEEAICRCP